MCFKIYINILTNDGVDRFTRQFPYGFNMEGFVFCENSQENIEWDYVVIYEKIDSPMNFRVRRGCWFISGEPQLSSTYTSGFLNQFDLVVTTHDGINHPQHVRGQPVLNWHFGYNKSSNTFTYNCEQLANMPPPCKIKNISIIASALRMLPGHVRRSKLVERLAYEFPDDIDIYGKGRNYIDDKAEAIIPYRFHIAIENSIQDDYWTEKLADAILGYSVPIYIGANNISKYFPREAMITIDDYNGNALCNIIRGLLGNGSYKYSKALPFVIDARKALIYEHNIYNVLRNMLIRDQLTTDDGAAYDVQIMPNDNWAWSKVKNYNLRVKRYLLKSFEEMRNDI